MIVPSIDIQDGQTVQLVGGKDHALDAGDPRPIADRFGRVGEIAVVDLDAALGTGGNAEIVRDLLSRARCRVGGGIRSVERALQWLDAGATSVVLGTAATPEVLSKLPRDRVWAALDCVNGEVVDQGWTRKTGRDVLERMEELRPYVGGFLVTFVEREGRMTGVDLDRVEKLAAAAGDRKLTVAGGITTAEQVAALDAMGVDAQVGMALYTGKLGLAEAFVAPVKSDRDDGLIPTVVCDARGVALGLAYSDLESITVALKEGVGAYRSRRRGLWRKGESSGATQRLLGIDVDCDRDTLRFRVEQSAPGFCHRATATCWGEQTGLDALEQTLRARSESAPPGSYTRRLFDDPDLLNAKILEESRELVEAQTPDEVVWEAADLIYFTLVRARAQGVDLAEVERELDRRSLRITRRSAKENESERGCRDDSSALALEPALPPAIESTLASDVVLETIAADEVIGRRRDVVDPQALARAVEIVDDVRGRGEGALLEWSVKLGDLEAGERWRYDREALEAAAQRLEPATLELLERTAQRIRRFAKAQREMFGPMTVAVDGGEAGHTIAPVDAAGCYAPGGRFPLPSSVLMTAVTARAAGVGRVVVASPKPDDVTLAAAAVAGADELVAVGGAQAIAALAYGAGDLAAVDVIVGPGNAYVTAAKKLVYGDVDIDMLAGPSELVVVADRTADPAVVAADLIAQAEHDPDAIVALIALDSGLIEAVRQELRTQLEDLSTAAIARESLANSYAVVASDRSEAVEICDALAPEHLQVLTSDADELAAQLTHYGALFIGPGSAEVFGDYGVGPNHVLPTGGTARFAGGLSVANFLRVRTWLSIRGSHEATKRDVVALARLEGLEGHARAAQKR